MKWEYLRLDIYNGSNPIDWGKLGSEQWELVAIYDDKAYFKRPIGDFDYMNQLAKVERVEIENPTKYDPNLQYKIVDGSEKIFTGGPFVDKDFTRGFHKEEKQNRYRYDTVQDGYVIIDKFTMLKLSGLEVETLLNND